MMKVAMVGGAWSFQVSLSHADDDGPRSRCCRNFGTPTTSPALLHIANYDGK